MVLTVLNVAYPFAPVGPDAVGGAEQILSTLDHALVERGHRSLVIACEGSSTAGKLFAIGSPQAGIITDDVRQRAWADYRAAIDDVLRHEPIDLIHMHGIDFAEYIPGNAATLATLHLPLDWYPPSVFQNRENLWLHCVSEAQHATRPDGVELLQPVPNGVSPRLFETSCRKRAYVMMLSRICPEKGIHIALEACRAAEVPLLIGGRIFPYETHQKYFRERIAPLLDEQRRFIGPIGFDRKRRLLASARCVLIPSLVEETSSLTAIEALACGTPVIAFPHGALPSIIDHSTTGFIVNDSEEMAEAITAAAELDPAKCKAAVRERFSLEKMTERYLTVYRLIRERSQRYGPFKAYA